MSQYTIPSVIERTPTGERSFDIFSRLLNERIVFLGTEIDDGVANGVFKSVDTVTEAHHTLFLATSIVDMCTGIFSWYTLTPRVEVGLLTDRYQRVALRMCGYTPRRRASRSA